MYLGSVGVGAGIRHGQNAWAGVGQLEVLVRELLSIDGLTTGAVEISKVTTLAHEIRNYAVEATAFKMKGLAGPTSTLLTCWMGRSDIFQKESLWESFQSRHIYKF